MNNGVFLDNQHKFGFTKTDLLIQEIIDTEQNLFLQEQIKTLQNEIKELQRDGIGPKTTECISILVTKVEKEKNRELTFQEYHKIDT